MQLVGNVNPFVHNTGIIAAIRELIFYYDDGISGGMTSLASFFMKSFQYVYGKEALVSWAKSDSVTLAMIPYLYLAILLASTVIRKCFIGVLYCARIVCIGMTRLLKMSQSSTADKSQSQNLVAQRKRKLTLARPKVAELKTARIHVARLKETTDMKEEMMAMLPMSKARPWKRKIFESRSLHPLPQSLPRKSEEFQSQCTGRANKSAASCHQRKTQSLVEQISPVQQTYSIQTCPTKLESLREKRTLKNTRPYAFHLQTEVRGVKKQRKFRDQLKQRQEEKQARLTKANHYLLSTDKPASPHKLEPKIFTKLEPYQLQSVIRYTEPQLREMEEQRKDKEEVQTRVFKEERMPLKQIQEFNLNVQREVIGGMRFDKKLKKQERMYGTYTEKVEGTRKMEEKKVPLNQLRTLFTHARPMPNESNPFSTGKSVKRIIEAKSTKHTIPSKERSETNKARSPRQQDLPGMVSEGDCLTYCSCADETRAGRCLLICRKPQPLQLF